MPFVCAGPRATATPCARHGWCWYPQRNALEEGHEHIYGVRSCKSRTHNDAHGGAAPCQPPCGGEANSAEQSTVSSLHILQIPQCCRPKMNRQRPCFGKPFAQPLPMTVFRTSPSAGNKLVLGLPSHRARCESSIHSASSLCLSTTSFLAWGCHLPVAVEHLRRGQQAPAVDHFGHRERPCCCICCCIRCCHSHAACAQGSHHRAILVDCASVPSAWCCGHYGRLLQRSGA